MHMLDCPTRHIRHPNIAQVKCDKRYTDNSELLTIVGTV